MYKIFSFISLFFLVNGLTQIIDPFSNRFQINQKGGLVFLANTSVSCNCADNNEMPPGGSGDNNGSSLQYVDIDNDATTFMSSADQLNLPNCSEISWAGLYWVGMLDNTPSNTPNFTSRNQIKLSVNGGNYQTLIADDLLDNDVGKTMYSCFKDITTIVQNNPINANYRVANLVTENGTNTFGGWTMVVVYKNVYETMKNITVFDGLANVTGTTGGVDINLSGFLTPPTGQVNFELGVVAHDGDRGQTGDQLAFNGAGTIVNINDALHQQGNSFNSTISKNGVLTPLRNPSYNNNLGHDANIYSPDNSALNYIGNSATTATILVSTNSETVLTSLITSAIEIYEPDLRASVSFADLNGGTVQAGDILEYTISAKNIGSDVSTNTFLTDTLDSRLQYIPGSLRYTFGPNTGVKTDQIDTDQAEFLAANNVIRARIGTGANGSNGGSLINSSTGADSTVITFQVQLNNDCALWQCGTSLSNKAYLFGTGQISGIANGNNGTSDVLDQNGCPSAESGLVNVDVTACAPFILNYDDSVCIGDIFQFSFPVSPNLTYNWTGPNGFASNLANPTIANIQEVQEGNYTLQVSYNNTACMEDTIASLVINENPIVQLIEIQHDTCYQAGGGFISVDGVGLEPFTYSWSNNDADNLAQNLTAGTYTVTATDNNSCSASNSYTVTEPDVFVITATITSDFNGQHISCFGENDGSASAVITGGTSPFTINWIGTGIQTEVISNLSAGQYIVAVSDQSSCTASDTVNLIEPDDIVISATITDVFCFGNSDGAIDVSLSGGTSPYNVSWSNSAPSEDLTSLSAGIYTITVTDLNNCSETQSFTVDQPNASLSLSATTTANLCNGDQTADIDLQVNGGVEPYDFSWSNGADSEDIQNLVAGSYTVTVNDANNCPQQFTQIISEPDPIVGTFSNINPVCQNGSQGSINMTVTGGTIPYDYSWNTSAITEDVTSLFSGFYVCTLTDANDCVATLTTTLSDPDALVITSTIVDDPCFNGANGMIDITISNGLAPFDFNWSNFTSNEDAIGLFAGTYFVNVADANNCGVFQSFVVDQPDTLLHFTVTNVSTLLCFGDNNASIDIEVAGGTGSYDYDWSTTAVSEDVNNLSAGTYTVTVTDDNACQLTQSIEIDDPADIQLTENHTDVLCKDRSTGSINLTANGGTNSYTFNWSNGAASEDLANISVGTYSVTVTDANSCSSSLSVAINEPVSSLTLTSITSPVLCFGATTGSIDLTIEGGTPNYSVLWTSGQDIQDISSLLAGTYTVTATDANGCTETHIVEIEQPLTSLSLSGNASDICQGASDGIASVVATGGSPGYSYLWNTETNNTSDLISGLGIGNYTVTVTDLNGCTEQLTLTIEQPEGLAGCVGLEMPNVFSPNGDKMNDFFLPVKALNIKTYNVTIMNRWGNLMYQGDEYLLGWDGQDAQEGVYFWVVDYTDNYGVSTQIQGNVTLLRD